VTYSEGIEAGMKIALDQINEELGTEFRNLGQFINHLWDVQRKATTIGVPYTTANFMKMKEEQQ
jgi:hypothetical protein